MIDASLCADISIFGMIIMYIFQSRTSIGHLQILGIFYSFTGDFFSVLSKLDLRATG